MKKEALAIFARPPILGRVKTRLAKDIGDKSALEVYECLLENTLQTVNEFNGDCFLFSSEKSSSFEKLININLEIQDPGDLGMKMRSCFSKLLMEYDKVTIIGSDCPSLTIDDIQHGFELLDTRDVVFGPANDGGYYLIGMKNMNSFLFEDIEWSTSDVLSISIKKVKLHNLSYGLLGQRTDIDILQDLKSQQHLFPLKINKALHGAD